jgi:hypothetical protein
VSAPALRPLGVGEILDVAIKITLRNWKTLVGLVALIVAPVQILVALIEISATEGILTTGEADTIDSDEVAVVVGGVVLIVIVGFMATILSQAVAFRAVVEAYLGGRPQWKESLAFVVRRLHSLLWLTLIGFVFLIVASVPCGIPAIWLGVSWIVAIPAMLTEDVRGVQALRRSFRLVRGRWWPAFGLLLIGVILVWIFAAIIEGIFAALFVVAESNLTIFLVNAVGGTLSSMLTTPFLAAFITVLYVDLRVRKEGFDLQLLAERVGAPIEAGEGPLLLPAPAYLPPEERGAQWEGEQPPFWPPPPGWKPRSSGESSSES